MTNDTSCFFVLFSVLSVSAFAAPEIVRLEAHQRFPWNGLVDIDCTILNDVAYSNDMVFVRVEIRRTDRDENFKTCANMTFESGTEMIGPGTNTFRIVWNPEPELEQNTRTNFADRTVPFDIRVQIRQFGIEVKHGMPKIIDKVLAEAELYEPLVHRRPDIHGLYWDGPIRGAWDMRLSTKWTVPYGSTISLFLNSPEKTGNVDVPPWTWSLRLLDGGVEWEHTVTVDYPLAPGTLVSKWYHPWDDPIVLCRTNVGEYAWTFSTGAEEYHAGFIVPDGNLVTDEIVEGEMVWGTNGIVVAGILKDYILSEWGRVVLKPDCNRQVAVVDGTVTIETGSTLTIAPGMVIKFTDGSGLDVKEGAHVIADGVTFTHIDDDRFGGDTLGDGDAWSPDDDAYFISGMDRISGGSFYCVTGVTGRTGNDGPSRPWITKKSSELDGAIYDAGGNILGVIRLKIAKPNTKKQTSRVTGSVILLDGKKRVLKSTVVSIPTEAPVSANITVKGIGVLSVKIGEDGFSGTLGDWSVASAQVGGKWAKADGAVYVGDRDVDSGEWYFANLPPGTLTDLLPCGEPIRVKSGKWTFNKAAAIRYVKGVLSGESDPKKPNRSALKLTYAPKSGIFKGLFRIYAVRNGKLKKHTAKVTGVVVYGSGAGIAKVARPAASWSVLVE